MGSLVPEVLAIQEAPVRILFESRGMCILEQAFLIILGAWSMTHTGKGHMFSVALRK